VPGRTLEWFLPPRYTHSEHSSTAAFRNYRMLVRLFARLTTARSVLDFFCWPVRISSYSSRAELGSDHVRRDWAEARPPANVGVGSRGCRDLRGVGGRDGGGPRFPYDTSTGARHFTGPGLAIQLFACPVPCAYFGHVRPNPQHDQVVGQKEPRRPDQDQRSSSRVESRRLPSPRQYQALPATAAGGGGGWWA